MTASGGGSLARPSDDGGTRDQWVTLALVASSVLLSTMDVSIVNIALPTLADEFDTTTDAVIWVVLVFVLLGTGLALPFGRLGDLYGRRRLYVGGNLIVALGLLAAGLAPTLAALIFARALQAVGNAMVVSNGNAIVTASFPARSRGQALGIVGAVVGAGLALGPVLGGVLIELFDWRAIFLVRLPLSLLVTFLLWRVLRDSKRGERAGGVDVLGSVALFGMLGSLALAVNRGGAWGWTDPRILGLLALGVALAPAFVAIQRRAASPVLELDLFRVRAFSSSVAAAILFFFGFAATLVLMPFYLVGARGFSTLEAGLILAAQPLTLLVFAPFTGRLADRFGPRLLVPLGLTVTSVGLVLLARIDAGTAIPDVALRLALVGLGMAVFQSPNNSTIMGSVPLERLGTASAAIVTARRIGQAAGIAIAGAVFTAAAGASVSDLDETGAAQRTLAIVDGLEPALLLAAAAAAAGVLVAWRWSAVAGEAPLAARRLDGRG